MHSLFKKLIISVSILAFAIFMTTGLLVKMEGMDMQKNGCVFMSGENALCDIGITAHLIHWRQMATINHDMLLLALLAVTYSVVRILQPKVFSVISIKKEKEKNRLLEKFDFLRDALRVGILHPKIYEKNIA